MSSTTLLIHSATIVNEGASWHGYIFITGDTITKIGHGEAPEELKIVANECIDAKGRIVMPGVIDTHVHFRDPGLTHKADMATESAAAVAGGVTSFIDMPNTKPATVTMEAVERKIERAAEVSLANYGFFIGATENNIEELEHADYTRVAGVKLFMGSSTGNLLVDDESMLDTIMERVPTLVTVHAEDESLLRANREAVEQRYGSDLPMEFHPVIRNHAVCFKASARAVEAARRHNHRLHLLHVSTANELELLTPGPVDGKLITAETCPQYLAFSDEEYEMLGTRIKCNPAIKRPTDRDALRSAVTDGRIDTIATDHAPHLPEEKIGNALTAVSGMPLIQFSLVLMMQMADDGLWSITDIVDKMCHNPARIYGIERRGFLREGYYADIVMVDNDCEPYTITDQWVISRCGWTPLNGLTVSNKVEMTLVNGQPAFRFGVLFSTPHSMALKFDRC